MCLRLFYDLVRKELDVVCLLSSVMQLQGLLSVGFGLDIPKLGIRKCIMGSCIITNVGAFGIEEAVNP